MMGSNFSFLWAPPRGPDVYGIVLGAPGAEISPAIYFATLKFKREKRLVDAYIHFSNSDPATTDFIVYINVTGVGTVSTITVPAGTSTSDPFGSPVTIAADAVISVQIAQTGVSPSTGVDGVLMLVFAA